MYTATQNYECNFNYSLLSLSFPLELKFFLILLFKHGCPELLHIELSAQLSSQPPGPLLP